MSNRRYLVLSDMHFGTPESSVNKPRYVSALGDYVTDRAPYDEIIFTGDLLDVNLSTLTRSIEGRGKAGAAGALCGFRDFLERLSTSMQARGGLPNLANRWIYLPGNHDYKIWDALATRVVCEDLLASGQRLDPAKMPLREQRFEGAASFFAGIFRPFQVEDRVIVEYPNHVVRFASGRSMVFTHGHYLDPSQTRGNDLAANLGRLLDAQDLDRVVRRIFIETAQYQAIANAVSFTDETRGLINDLVGPDGIANKVKKVLTTIGRWISSMLFRSKSSLRHKDISARMLANIDVYVERFCKLIPVPSWFVFGHTHRQGQAKTKRHGIEVYNVGSCYPDRGMPITFLEVDVEDDTPTIHLLGVDDNGAIRQVSQGPSRGDQSCT